MIATDITGSATGDVSQVFNLLAVVANPELYGDKLKALVEATEEHKKYLALVAPASEIVTIRQQIDSDKAKAKEVLIESKAKAKQVVKSAEDDAARIVAEAKEQLELAKQNAAALEEEAKNKVVAVEGIMAEYQRRMAEVSEAESKVRQEKQMLHVAQAKAKEAQDAAIAYQQLMLAKVAEFARELAK